MSVPNIYSSTDAGAPTFIPNDSTTWLPLLKACLVNGYTGKPGAGWTIAYEDDVAQTLVLRQGSGNQRYLWLGNPGYSASNTYIAMRYFQAVSYLYMSDINDGTGMWPTAANQNVWSMASSYNAQSGTALQWRVFASNKFFLIYIYPTQSYTTNVYPKQVFFFGDFPSTVQNDTYNTILNGYNISSTSYSWNLGNGSSDNFPFSNYGAYTSAPGQALWVAGPYYQQLGLPQPVRFNPRNLALVGNGYSASGSANTTGVNFFPDFCTNGLYLSQLDIHEYWNSTASIRGTLPGIFAPCFNTVHADGTIVEGTGDLAGHQFMSVNNLAHFPSATLYIQVDEWND